MQHSTQKMNTYSPLVSFASRKSLAGLFAIACLALSNATNLNAEYRTITFGVPNADPAISTGWLDTGLVSGDSSTQSCTISEDSPDGVIKFELTVLGSGTVNSNNNHLSIAGGLNDGAIDSRTWSDAGDNEWLEFSLSVSGPGSKSVMDLSFGGLQLVFAKDRDNVRFYDATAWNDIINPANDIHTYHMGSGSALDGLTPLSIKTVGDRGDGTWSLALEGLASGDADNQINTLFRIDNLSVNYRIADEVTRVGDVLGVAHTGGKYTTYGPGSENPEDYLNEGADLIEITGSKVVKVFMGKNYASSHFYWNSDWPEVASVGELAQTPNFRQFFSRPALTTYLLDVTEFAFINWKNGMSETELQKSYDEIYDLATHLLSTYSNKTFIIQNWEGDNAFGSPADVAAAEQGMIDWLNIRQEAINQARDDVESTSKVWGAAEFNKLPKPFALSEPAHTIIDTVIPYTKMDLYSLSNYLTEKNDKRENLIFEMLEYMDQYCPDSRVFGNKNLYFGEYGSKENVLGANFPNQNKKVLHRQMAGRQLEQALRWGVKYIVYWAAYDNVLKNGVSLPEGVEATNDQLLGNWLIRPDNTLTQLFDYYSSITVEPLATYADLYEFENYPPVSPTKDPITLVHATLESSGGYHLRFNADAAGDEIKYSLYVPEAGTYEIELGYRTEADAGIVRVFVGGVAIGQEIDTYSSDPAYASAVLNETKTFNGPGIKDFKFRSKGQNADSSGYKIYLDYIRLIKPGNEDSAWPPVPKIEPWPNP